MIGAGISVVRLAEFGWSRIEPVPGEFDWTWLDEAIGVYAAAGLGVVLGTPTAAPPAWLARRSPETAARDRYGRVRGFGSRRHGDPSSPVYRTESARITRAMAERYGRHPALIGWQIDNEFGDHDTGLSFSPAAIERFRGWLAERYATIERLNETWATRFDAGPYGCWAEIDPPDIDDLCANPAHVLDFRRASSDAIVAFASEQVAILRAESPGRWVTHNAMRLCGEYDHYSLARLLDFTSLDVYPTGAVEFTALTEAERVQWARIGQPDIIGFNHDLYRGMSRRPHWVMEGQAGQINWAPSNCLPAEGAVALWAAQTYAHGGACFSVFRWRAATSAQEIMHSGLVRHDGTDDRGLREITALSRSTLPLALTPREVCLLHDYESLWLADAAGPRPGESYWDELITWYTAVRKLGVDLDVRHPDDELAGYRVVIAADVSIVDDQRISRWQSAMNAGAHLVLGGMTGQRTPSGHGWPAEGLATLAALAGCRARSLDWQAVDGRDGSAVGGCSVSFELIGGEALLLYERGPLANEAAIVRFGRVTSVGTSDPSLIAQVVVPVLKGAGIATASLAEGIRRSRVGDGVVWQNWTAAAEVGGVRVPAYSTAIVGNDEAADRGEWPAASRIDPRE